MKYSYQDKFLISFLLDACPKRCKSHDGSYTASTFVAFLIMIENLRRKRSKENYEMNENLLSILKNAIYEIMVPQKKFHIAVGSTPGVSILFLNIIFRKLHSSCAVFMCDSAEKENYKSTLYLRDSMEFSEPRGFLETIPIYINIMIPYLDIQCSDSNYSKDILKIPDQLDSVSCALFVLNAAMRLCTSRDVRPKESFENGSYRSQLVISFKT